MSMAHLKIKVEMAHQKIMVMAHLPVKAKAPFTAKAPVKVKVSVKVPVMGSLYLKASNLLQLQKCGKAILAGVSVVFVLGFGITTSAAARRWPRCQREVHHQRKTWLSVNPKTLEVIEILD